MAKKTRTPQLTVVETSGMDRSNEPVVSGIPWSKGAVSAEDRFTLRDASGASRPLEVDPVGWWPDGSVKWTLLTARIDAPAGKTSRFTLERKAPPKDDRPPLRVRDGRLGVDIDTGRMRLRVDRKEGLVERVRIRDAGGAWRTLVSKGIGLFITRCDPDGRKRRVFIDAPDGERDVSVLSSGPERCVVRVAGRHIDERGRDFCRYIVHLTCLRDSDRLDVQHTLVYTGTPDRDLVATFGVDARLDLRKSDRRFTFGDEGGPGVETVVQPTPDHPHWRHGRLLQLAATAFRMEKRTDMRFRPVKIAEGTRSDGWAALGDASRGATAVVRDAWKRHPKGFVVDADEGLLRVELQPDDGAPLDLRRYSDRVHSALYEAGKAGAVFPSDTHGAHGVALTHELAFVFHADAPGPGDLARAARSAADPLVLLADPEWYCESGAVGAVAPLDESSFPEQERVFAELTDFMQGERERCGWHGMIDDGDWMQTYDHERDCWAFDHGGHAWVNTEHLPDQWLWLAFFRTARLDRLEAACAMTRHNRDLDMYHHGMLRGVGTRHNVNHWGCADKEWRVSMPLSKRWHYFLTGDPWTREVVLDTVDVYRSYERTSRTAPSMSSALCGLLARSELTGDPADMTAARNMADAYAKAVLPDGRIARNLHADISTGAGGPVGEETMDGSMFFFNDFGCLQVMCEMADLFCHDGLAEALVRHARSELERNAAAERPRFLDAKLSAFALRRTGEKAFRKDLEGWIASRADTPLVERGGDGPLDTPRHRTPSWRSKKQTCGMAGICIDMTFALAGLRKA